MADDVGLEPVLECDLVMKGGVTSGIVYPAAIASIASKYRLRSVGGTSAGAIGAAAAAAMEFGRASGRNPAAASQIASLADELGTPVDGRPLLLRLFTADETTSRLFGLIMGLMDSKSRGGWGAVARRLLGLPLLASGLVYVLVVVFIGLSLREPVPTRIGVAIIFMLVSVPGLAILLAILRWLPILVVGLRAVAGNGFGFCSGMATYRRRDGGVAPSLSEWLHGRYQALAGLDSKEPLTFGHLWVADHMTNGTLRSEAIGIAAAEYGTVDRAPRRVELSLVASDINRGLSVQLPFMRREDAIYARPSDLQALVPRHVFEWMVEKAQDKGDLSEVDLHGVPIEDLIRLPRPEDLPVLLAVRMSLSFPFLFRAVRLYVLRRTRSGRELAELWIADGGITSNFPIHLFDAPIPARPTFCLNLLYHDDELEPDREAAAMEGPDGESAATEALELSKAEDAPEPLVFMLSTNWSRLSGYTQFSGMKPVESLARFAGRIVSTARQWGDNQLIDVPGYRDRIVHIRMLADEGGFNFDMGAPKITDLGERGAWAGELIATRFLPTTVEDPQRPGRRLDLNWSNHRWVRFRSFLSGMEVAAGVFSSNWTRDMEASERPAGDPRKVSPSLGEILEKSTKGTVLPQYVGYRMANGSQVGLGQEMVERLRGLATLTPDPAKNGIDFASTRPGSPRPKGIIKLRPPAETDPLAESPRPLVNKPTIDSGA